MTFFSLLTVLKPNIDGIYTYTFLLRSELFYFIPSDNFSMVMIVVFVCDKKDKHCLILNIENIIMIHDTDIIKKHGHRFFVTGNNNPAQILFQSQMEIRGQRDRLFI